MGNGRHAAHEEVSQRDRELTRNLPGIIAED
jgi:hypothetical protein